MIITFVVAKRGNVLIDSISILLFLSFFPLTPEKHTMATTAADSLQQVVAALNALYNAPGNSAKKEANLWLEDFQAKVRWGPSSHSHVLQLGSGMMCLSKRLTTSHIYHLLSCSPV